MVQIYVFLAVQCTVKAWDRVQIYVYLAVQRGLWDMVQIYVFLAVQCTV